MVKMKIDNEELWQDIKSKKIKGLSIEGYFTDKFEAMQKNKTKPNKRKQNLEILDSALNEIMKK
jgi:ribosomal protein S17E